METFLEYDKKTFDMIIHHTQERILKQMYERRLEELEIMMNDNIKKSRMEIGGDRGIHLGLYDNKIQDGH